MSLRFTEICQKLQTEQPYNFEVVCNDYLKARYPNLTPWLSTNVPHTIAGTPDAFMIDEIDDGEYLIDDIRRPAIDHADTCQKAAVIGNFQVCFPDKKTAPFWVFL
ncbi:MAG: hypothetical protein V1753_09070 [Pseudomonadota bacterium]